jgi:DNA-binding MarR family transcriptional regulator
VTPRCPLVLAQLASGPRPAHEIARGLGGDQGAALATLARLQGAGLVRRRRLPRAADYQLTARGRRELDLQRRLWARVAMAQRASSASRRASSRRGHSASSS